MWAWRLHNTCNMGGSQHFITGVQNHKMPTSGPGVYITPALWVPNVSQQGTKLAQNV